STCRRSWRKCDGAARRIASRAAAPTTTRAYAKASALKPSVGPTASASWTPARRWRSCRSRFDRRWSVSWQRVRGHDAQIEAFQRAVQRHRLAHAYLFVGPPGVGKRLFALELAKALLCETPAPRLEACDRCPPCVLVEAGTHPDFFPGDRPEGSHELPIEVMRELCGNFSLKSARGRGKVALLDDADDLNDAAANCFLKTLEEPPPRSVLILIGTTAERQLATILS